MINKKRIWFGLAASLAISPILVATVTLPTGSATEPQIAVLQPSSAAGPMAENGGGHSGEKQTEPLLPAPAPAVPPPEPPEAATVPMRASPVPPPVPLPPPPSEPAPPAPPTEGTGAAPPAPVGTPIAAPPGTPATTSPGTPNGIAPPGALPPFQLTGEPKKGGGPTPPPAEGSTQPTPAQAQAADTATPKKFSPGSAAPPTEPPSSPVPAGSPVVAGPSQDPTSAGGTGVGALLSNSNSALGVEVQKRSPVVGDPRVQGLHFGQLSTYADGGYWFPARVDLDTVVSKLNANDIDNILIIRGPFSVRYGPSFSVLDIQSIGTPRYKDGFEVHGSSSGSYRTNGQGWQGQQSIWGGGADWGFRISYDLQTAVNYVTGNGTQMPSGYNNQFVNFAYGFNLTPDSSLELKYLHAQQSNVVYPGLLTDINNLSTDAFSARYAAVKGSWYDRFTLDTWINSTRFNGDSNNPGTRAQVPQLDNIFRNLTTFLPVRLDMTTNGDSLSYGAREITTWGDVKGFNVSMGADIKVFSSGYNEFNSFGLSVLNPLTSVPPPALPGFGSNFGIPNTRQIDPGLLMDMAIPVGDQWSFKVGGRADFVTSQFLSFGPNVQQDVYRANVGNPDGSKTFPLFAAFVTSEYKINSEWTAQAGYGFAERAPTATELYTGGAFLGLLQNGFNTFYGNTNLKKEEMHQINVGLNGNYEKVRAGVNGFYSIVNNYITYQQSPVDFRITAAGFAAPIPADPPIQTMSFINTGFATLWGFDGYTEVDATPYLTPFFTLNYTQGWDQSRDVALPGIAPLSSRIGVRFHEDGKNPKWGIEYFARVVATQNLFASNLLEQRTGGFTTHNLRAYWQARENVSLLAGVDNIGNLQYREHLDLRTGQPFGPGVFQPGVNFYIGGKLSY